MKPQRQAVNNLEFKKAKNLKQIDGAFGEGLDTKFEYEVRQDENLTYFCIKIAITNDAHEKIKNKVLERKEKKKERGIYTGNDTYYLSEIIKKTI